MLDGLTERLATTVASALSLSVEEVAAVLGPPSKAGAGDLALPCFRFAKRLGAPPPEIAATAAAALESAHPEVEAAATGPFLNLTFRPGPLAATVLPAVEADPAALLRSRVGDDRCVCIDFSSPNIAKHLAFHHIRSTGIGNALANCYAAAGWRVVRINFLGDWGTPFGRLMAGWKRESLDLDDLRDSRDQVGFLNRVYVRISRSGARDDAVDDEAREWSRRLEQGDPEARELWGIFRPISVEAFRRVYDLLGIEFDLWSGESEYVGPAETVVDELATAGLLREDDGAQVVDLTARGMDKPCLIKRSDGVSLYAARDLAASQDRFDRFAFDRSLYVVDLGQSLHFSEWFAVADLAGKPWADRLRHVGFGVVQMWNEEEERWAKTATRQGVPMLLLDVLEEAVVRAETVIAEKNPDLSVEERAAVARAVGTGAVLFNDLKNQRKGDVKFSFSEALNMQGETGPYLQYAHARLCSIERKFAAAHPEPPAGDAARLEREDEKGVLLAACRLRGVLERTVEEDAPSLLAAGLIELAGRISTWLTAGNHDRTARVLCDDADLSAARVRLVRMARGALAEGLRLLGITAPERM